MAAAEVYSPAGRRRPFGAGRGAGVRRAEAARIPGVQLHPDALDDLVDDAGECHATGVDAALAKLLADVVLQLGASLGPRRADDSVAASRKVIADDGLGVCLRLGAVGGG